MSKPPSRISRKRKAAVTVLLHALYNLLWYPALPFALLASNGADAQGSRERLGIAAPRSDSTALRIWAHASSVGEIEAIHSVMMRLMRDAPASVAVITAMTTAGRDVARRRIPKARAHLLAPLDNPSAVRAFLRRVRPDLVLIAETELWPNYFWEAKRHGAKVAIINGRISERSLKRYQRLGSLFVRAIKCADLIMAQTAHDVERFAAMGAERRRIVVTGNTKFDPDAAAEMPLRRQLQEFAGERPIFIAGSTAAGEEEVILQAYRKLREEIPSLALIIAPRHLVRVLEVEKLVAENSLTYVRASAARFDADADVMILDTMGELRPLYRRATVAFVGGTLNETRGGQNPAEPASVSVPVMLGPYFENQQETASALIAVGGARVVSDADEMVRVAQKWLTSDEARRTAGRAARECIVQMSGCVATSLMHLRTLITLA
jgi:3-deoxy-D-manno-octulosonic-acid transferase